jgi:hypothetical protein
MIKLFRHTAALILVTALSLVWSACMPVGQGTLVVTAPTLTITPSAATITTAQALTVSVVVTGATSTPTGSVTLNCGNYTSAPATLSGGSASISIAAGALAVGNDTLTVLYTPDSSSSAIYSNSGGTGAVTVTPPKSTPTVSVSPSASSITNAQALTVSVGVSGSNGTPTGSVTLSSGGYTSAAATLSGGSASISIAAGALAVGSDTLTVSYAPDSASSALYSTASGAGAVTVIIAKTAPAVAVSPSAGSITNTQALTVSVGVSGSNGTPTGAVTLSSGNYTSAPATLSSGKASISIAAGALAVGSDTLTVSYAPDSASSALYSTASGAGAVTVIIAKTAPAVAVSPSASSITNAQALTVSVSVSGSSGTPTGAVTLSSGSYTSAPATLSGGKASISIAAGALAVGSDTLTVSYTPDSASSALYSTASGTGAVTVTTSKNTPTVSVSPSASSISTTQALTVSVGVSGSSGTPTGAVTLSSGSYTSAPATLSGGSASINIAAGALAVGSDTLTASYTPDSASSATYSTASGTGAVTVTVTKTTPTVSVSPSAGSITNAQALTVSVGVSGSNGTPTGSVTLSGGGYTSASAMLSGGKASINIAAGALTAGSDTLTVSYTPDSASSALYFTASGTGAVTVTIAKTTPAVSVSPSAGSINTTQALTVSVAVSGNNGTPTGSVILSGGGYTSASATLSSGKASFSIAAGALAVGSDTLTVSYTPDSNSSAYTSATGTATLAVSQYLTPTVTVTPATFILSSLQSLPVAVKVNGVTGFATPTGTVTLTSGSYASAAATLSGGAASITIPSGVLPWSNDTITATYTPDSASKSTYTSATGVSAAVTVDSTTVIVNQTPTSVPVTSKILGMNMEDWYDVVNNQAMILNGFQTVGVSSVRWPGGTWADVYHLSTNTACQNIIPAQGSGTIVGEPNVNDTFANFLSDIIIPGKFDLNLTANYGTDPTCTTGGLPSEAASWITTAKNAGVDVGYMAVGNEEYGTWEPDLHPRKNDPTTYAAAMAGSNGFYKTIKAANPKTQVGIDANPGYSPWDQTVMSNARGSYDFAEYHFYPYGPGQEDDYTLLHNPCCDAQQLTTVLNTIKGELAAAGAPGTPLVVGEIGSTWGNPGKQSMSIVQALFAGEILGEMMNAGVVSAQWWAGFAGCDSQGEAGAGNFSSSLYGWQNFGGYTLFSDGYCDGGPAQGTVLPTARAYQLFSQVAVSGEWVLTPTVSGDTIDIVAYAATHFGGTGTALVIFNLDETQTEYVAVGLSKQTSSANVTVSTYDKGIYDLTNANPAVWAAPVTTSLGSQNLPLTLTLTPWSMNVILIQ